ncbi:LuxR C-terminal-related transcriptional regulator [Streptomyces sp. NPDC055036]
MIIDSIDLAPRERQVLERVANGVELFDVALDLSIGRGTAASYLQSARKKLHGVRSTRAAVAVGIVTRAITAPTLLDPGELSLPRPQLEIALLKAQGMSLSQIATTLDRPRTEVNADGIKLSAALDARNDNHLVTRMWALWVLDAEQVAKWLRCLPHG